MLSPPAGTIDDGLRALYPLLRATCHTVLRGTGYVDYAEDAAQLAALLLWRHWTAFLPVRGTREAWAATIAHHAAIDRAELPKFMALLSKQPGTGAHALSAPPPNRGRWIESRGEPHPPSGRAAP